MKRSLALRLAAILAAVAATISPAFAAVPAEVTTALTDMKADGLEIAGVVLVAVIALFAFKFMRKGVH